MTNWPQTFSEDLRPSSQTHCGPAAVKTELQLWVTGSSTRRLRLNRTRHSKSVLPQRKTCGWWTHSDKYQGNFPQFWTTQPVALTSSLSRFITHSSFWAPSMNSDKVIWPVGHRNNRKSEENREKIVWIRTSHCTLIHIHHHIHVNVSLLREPLHPILLSIVHKNNSKEHNLDSVLITSVSLVK